MNPTLMKSNRLAFLSDIRPKYVSDNIWANANAATIMPISKTDFATLLAMIGMNTKVIAIPECWKNVVPLTKLFRLSLTCIIFFLSYLI